MHISWQSGAAEKGASPSPPLKDGEQFPIGPAICVRALPRKRGSRACPWLEQEATAAALQPLDSRFRGCNPIGIDEHGHDFDMSLSRCPGESRDPCFHKSLSLNVFCDRAPRESPRRLRYGSRPAPGRRDMQRRAMNANWIAASFAGTTKWWPKQVSDEQRSTLYIVRR